MGLLVLGPVGGVGEPLGAVELLGEFAGEGLVTGVRSKVDLAIFQASKRSRAAFKLKNKNMSKQGRKHDDKRRVLNHRSQQHKLS